VVRVLTDGAAAVVVESDGMAMAFQALRGAVNVKAHADCPMCGHDLWAGGDRLTEIRTLAEPVIEALPFVCVNCGFVRLHAIQPLETIDE
jgi:hypothetical protein